MPGLDFQIEVDKTVSENKVDWKKYAELWRRAYGKSEEFAKEILDAVGYRMRVNRVVDCKEGYMIEFQGVPRDFIEAYVGGLRTKIVKRGDAVSLAEALGLMQYTIIRVNH